VVNLGELGEGTVASDVVHPRQVVDVVLHRVQDAVQELGGISLRGAWEGNLDVVLAKKLTKLSVSGLDALAPAGLGLALTIDNSAVKVEPLVTEGLREVVGANLEEAGPRMKSDERRRGGGRERERERNGITHVRKDFHRAGELGTAIERLAKKAGTVRVRLPVTLTFTIEK